MILEEIAELARIRPFSALSEAEKQMVLSEMPEAEYQILHQALTALPLLDADIEPPEDLRADLLARFARARRAPWQRAFSRTVPAWQAAAAVLIGIGFTIFFLKRAPREMLQKTVYQTIIQKDTVWQTQTRWRERRIVRVEKPMVAGVQNDWKLEKLGLEQSPTGLNPEPLAAPSSIGTPMSDRLELMDFFVSEKEVKGER